MSVRGSARRLVTAVPALDATFRRRVWSRIRFPEAGMGILHRLRGRPIDVAVNVGAELGHHAWVLDRKARRVIAFEPGKANSDFREHGLPEHGSNYSQGRRMRGGVVPMYTPWPTLESIMSRSFASARSSLNALARLNGSIC